MTTPVSADVSSLSTPDLLDACRTLLGELSGRVADPGLVDRVPSFPTQQALPPADEWGLYADLVEEISLDEAYEQTPVDLPIPRGTFPELAAGVEELGRAVEAARTALAGHAARLFEAPDGREDLLGIPAGKCAYRNAVEYLREHLRIPRQQSKTRIERAREVMATRTLDRTEHLPPRLPLVAQSMASADVDPSAVDIIVTTLTGAREEAVHARVTPAAVEELIGEGERLLVASARESDPDTLRKVCGHWRARFDAAVNADGKEPTEAQLHAAQGLFYKGRKAGLHRWFLMATDGQHEILRTIAAAASNPRRGDGTVAVLGDAGAGPVDGVGGSVSEAPADPRGGTDAHSGVTGPKPLTATGEAPPVPGHPPGAEDVAEAVGATGPGGSDAPVEDGTGRSCACPTGGPCTCPTTVGPGRSPLSDPTVGRDPTGTAGTLASREGDRRSLPPHAQEPATATDEEDAVAASLEEDRECRGEWVMEGPAELWGRQAAIAEAVAAADAAERSRARPPQGPSPSEAPPVDSGAPVDSAGRGSATSWDQAADAVDVLDLRTTGQRELDGLISALTGALALATGPDPSGGGGGVRPQVMVTIDYETLLAGVVRGASSDAGGHPGRHCASAVGPPPGSCTEPCCDSGVEHGPGDASGDPDEPLKVEQAVGRTSSGPGPQPRGDRYSAAAYAGQIGPTTIRAWACDAELIPVVLGGEGEVLDVGRSRRLFSRTLRRALVARDGGCAAPGCTIPAPWCEAHHIEHWEHGGPTSVDNGVLLCSHHHHAVHAGAWTISMRHGIPWFIPAAYHDPCQRPRRNRYWRPGAKA